ncbi:MAG TPA: beta-L-arabinofuranosidase domain-containing protein [Capsulimonadaceae bacterium]|jgi:hypothetical protein
MEKPAILAIKPSLAIESAQSGLCASQLLSIGGFVGERWQANKSGSLSAFDIDKYVKQLEDKSYVDWFWIGEQVGKWLEASVLTDAISDDSQLSELVETILSRVVNSQEPEGYLGITSASLRTSDKPLRGMDPYEQYFTMHGLLTAYEVLGDELALNAATKLATYYVDHISPGKAEFWPSPYRPPFNLHAVVCPQASWVPDYAVIPQEQYVHSDIAGHTAHYGLEGTLIIDPILRLYELTGNPALLSWAKWIVEQIDVWTGWNVFSRLDDLANGMIGIHELQPYVHAHTFHMNFLAFLRLYRITGDTMYLGKVTGAWNDISARQMYITGGVSVGEHYEAGFLRPLDGSVVETCANMSWMELNQALLEITSDSRYADVQERLLWNHVFAAQEVDGTSYRYHTPPNGFKPEWYFHGPDCCTSSGARLVALLPKFIYAQAAGKIIVNQYVASSAEFGMGARSQVTIEQLTDYPSDDNITIKVTTSGPCEFAISFRLPGWCASPEVEVNGSTISHLNSGTYLEVHRVWHSGDTVNLRFPMVAQWIQHDHLPEGSELWGIMRGPVVYATDTTWWDVNGEPPPADSFRDMRALPSGLISKAELPIDGMLGPALRADFLTRNEELIRPLLVPFANVGRWYSDEDNKPEINSRAYSYAVWFKRD